MALSLVLIKTNTNKKNSIYKRKKRFITIVNKLNNDSEFI
jgi:hypothetical protein